MLCYFCGFNFISEVKGENDEVTTLKTFYGDEKVNDFSDYYRPYELTNLEKLFCFNMPNSIKQVLLFNSTMQVLLLNYKASTFIKFHKASTFIKL